MTKRGGLSNHELIHGQGCSDLGIPSCFECPLPVCRYELPSRTVAGLLTIARLAPILAAGATTHEAAAQSGLGWRQVHRIRTQLRSQYHAPTQSRA
jgi:hypothetical protein